ncbi:hypothetical protein RchiOBHm_Chr6g0265251 [Rosa chinensis]|uniref:Uncharacterized protein n=1 Tax=Rosa chinensis TaxID=74649 RepID=A0A2P6PPE2_ROSCH|nr:hypothetical protein RchiOBHm_Chr6g0265251 [Rosa chinensis]
MSCLVRRMRNLKLYTIILCSLRRMRSSKSYTIIPYLLRLIFPSKKRVLHYLVMKKLKSQGLSLLLHPRRSIMSFPRWIVEY